MATYAMCLKITFPANNGRRELVLRKISEAHIESSTDWLTDKASITLPRNIKITEDGATYNKYDLKKVFRIGDPVIIELGYNGDAFMQEEFKGYITDISADIPFVIKCEDEM